MAPSTNIPRHNIIDNEYCADLSWITVMCHGVRFQISIAIEDIESSDIEQQYLMLAEKLENGHDDVQDETDLQDLMLKPCYSRIQELIPAKPKNITLQQFYYPSTYFLKLVSKHNTLIAEVVDENDSQGGNPMMIPISDLPDHPGIPIRCASSTWIAPSDRPNDDHTCEFPSKVLDKDGKIQFFKPAFYPDQITREIETHVKMLREKLTDSLRVPKLHAIVLSEDKEMVVGLVFDLVPSDGFNMQSQKYILAKEHHAKWKVQMVELVAELHKHDIVWGDVHPGNIVIDKRLNAWAVDFGGGWVEEFVSRKDAGTKEGDWKGLRRIFDTWLNRAT